VELAAAALDVGGGEDEALADVADRLRARVADASLERYDEGVGDAVARLFRAAWPMGPKPVRVPGQTRAHLEDLADHAERARRELESVGGQLGVEAPGEESLVDLAALVHVALGELDGRLASAASAVGIDPQPGLGHLAGRLAHALADGLATLGDGTTAWAREAHAALQRIDAELAERAPAHVHAEARAGAGEQPSVRALINELPAIARSRAWGELDEVLEEDEDLAQALQRLLGAVDEADDPVDVQLVTSISFAEDVLRRFDSELAHVPQPSPSERADRLSVALEGALR
jgi:hypothetical protein